jgi:hypothetical protein
MSPRYDEVKFLNLMLYVAHRLMDDPAGGATKFNKTLYYAEFGHVRRHGRPITGAVYQRLPWGPAPRRLRPLRDQLISEGRAELREETFMNQTQHRLVPLVEPDLAGFSAEELGSIDRAVAALHGRTGTATSTMSHDEVGWQMVAEREEIPYETAYLRQPVRSAAIRRHGIELARRLGRL